MRVKSQYNLGPNPLLTKVIPIGIWDMDVTPSVAIAHGLTLSKIRVVSAFIADDVGTYVYSISYCNDLASPDGRLVVGVTTIGLYCRTGGFFDSIWFDDGAMNRGYITIQYVS